MTIEARFAIQQGDFTSNVELSMPARGVTAVFGPSGCGKTTLLRAIAGLDRHQAGFIKVADTVWQQGSHFVPTHRRSLAYVFQEASLFAHLTVRKNLEYGLKRVPKAERKVPLDQVISLLAIEHLLQRKPETLSGGERQRVAIARALAVSPKLLLMDEPLASLDSERKQEVFPYIESLHNELDIPIIYVSHAPDEVARVADQLVLMAKGEVIASGTIADMLTRLDLPMAHNSDAASIVDAVVAGHDERYALSYLEHPGGCFTVARNHYAKGSRVRLSVAARDVSVALSEQPGTSILNCFPAVVDAVCDEGLGQVTVRLVAGGVPLLSRITRKSAHELGLRPGKAVYAQVKTVALLR